jgi:hypothetical protein
VAVAHFFLVRSNLVRCALCVLTLGLVLNGCEADRYQWNLRHAEVMRTAHLQHDDFEEIVRMVTHATNEPVLWIEGSGSQVAGPHEVTVFTGTSISMHSFSLRKQGSEWRIGSILEQPEID